MADIKISCGQLLVHYLVKIGVGKVPHRYDVQVSDTTMMTIDKMLVKKILLRHD